MWITFLIMSYSNSSLDYCQLIPS